MDTPSAAAPRERIPVAVLGATGLVGQRFVARLAAHPWFELVAVTGSERSAGAPYGEAARWALAAPLPEHAAQLPVLAPDADPGCPLVFSALGADAADPLERARAAAGALVVSNASAHRMHPAVPLIVPEVNPDHLALVERQDFGPGGIVAGPNCSAVGLVLALAPLHRAFGVERAHVVTLQARSGAGLAGLADEALARNVVPRIAGEEEKLEREPRKILGALAGGAVREAELVVSAQCNRVDVIDGHLLCVSVGLRAETDEGALRAAWEGFRGEPQRLGLPSAPERPVVVRSEEDRPQPRQDLEDGMAASVGRLRPCPVLGHRFVTLSHNAERGAAGGALLIAELAVARGLVG